jgi:carbohydrate diacid regulator
MAVMINPFESVADTIADRATELLATRVCVADAQGTIIASSDRGLVGRHRDDVLSGSTGPHLSVPLRAFQQSGEVIVSEAAAGEGLSPRLAGVFVDLVVGQAVAALRLPNHRELTSRFIHNLLLGHMDDDDDEILRESDILGIDLRVPRALILIDAADYILPADGVEHREADSARIRRQSQLVIASVVNFFSLPTDTICAYIGGGEIAILKASSTHDLEAWADADSGTQQSNASWANLSALKRAGAALLGRLRQDTRASVSVGIGRYHPGVVGLARSYEDARAALLLGRRFHGPNQVYCLDGLGAAAFIGISDERTKLDLATHLLSPLDQDRELLDTLEVFFTENCSANCTAARLCIHRNTLSYRLDKVSLLTGLDPRHFDDAVQIRLALLTRSLQSHAG